MKRTLKGASLAFAFAAALVAAPGERAAAATPDNMLVMGMRIDDIITFDPAEVFELSTGEFSANIYDRITTYRPDDFSKLVGGVAESWEVSEDGKRIDFKVRDGITFHSGNKLTAEDAVFSLRRVIKLNKTPAFIFTQFGWNPENVDQMVEKTGDMSFAVKIDADLSPGLVLNALSAGVGSVVDKAVVLEHEKDGDLGYGWLKTNSAGSGPYSLKAWNANESVMLEAYDGYWRGAPAMKRVVARHLPEPAAQRLLLEQGDIDIARTLTPDQIAGLEGQEDIVIDNNLKATSYYLAMNQKVEALDNPKVQEAARYLVDYSGMADSFLSGRMVVQQSFWPSGLWGAITDNPYALNVEKAKALLAEAGYPDGFPIKIDTLNTSPYMEIAQSLQATLGQVGIKAEIIPQDGSALWPKYRARRHEMILARWAPDYLDPHSNADSFAHNPNNSDEAQLTGKLAWRNGWKDDEINALTEAAAKETDLAKREDLYHELLKKHQANSPFVLMFQENEQVARKKSVKGFVSGPSFDLVYLGGVTKE